MSSWRHLSSARGGGDDEAGDDVAELRVDTCALRGAAQDVWELAGQVDQGAAGLGPAAAAALPAVGTAVSGGAIAAGAERLREVMVSLGWGLQLLSAGLEQSAQWYEAAELRAAQQARATGVPQAAVYGPPPVGPVQELQSLVPEQGSPSAAAGPGTP